MTSILIQKLHPCIGNLNSEMAGDSKNVFLHWGDVLGLRIRLKQQMSERVNEWSVVQGSNVKCIDKVHVW